MAFYASHQEEADKRNKSESLWVSSRGKAGMLWLEGEWRMGSREAGGHGGWSVRGQRGAYLTATSPGPLGGAAGESQEEGVFASVGRNADPLPAFP